MQRGEGTCPDSPTVFLIDMGLKFMASSSKSTVEGGKGERIEKERESLFGPTPYQTHPNCFEVCQPSSQVIVMVTSWSGNTKLENWVLALALPRVPNDFEQKDPPWSSGSARGLVSGQY